MVPVPQSAWREGLASLAGKPPGEAPIIYGHGYSQSGSAYKQCCNAYSQSGSAHNVTSSVAMLIRRAALHISSVKMAYLQSIRRTSTCSKSNIYLRGGGTDNILGGGGALCMR